MKIRDILTELSFAPESAYNLKWDVSGRVTRAKATNSEYELTIFITKEYTTADGSQLAYLEFQRNGQIKITNEGDVVRIMSTVIQAVKQYLDKNKRVKYLTFSAKEPSRVKFYNALVKRLASANNLTPINYDDLPLNNQEYKIPYSSLGTVYTLKRL